jgi:hypothetical protein
MGACRRLCLRTACISSRIRAAEKKCNTLIQVLRTLAAKSLSTSSAPEHAMIPLPVMCMSWNCSGSVLAVASGSCSSALLEHHIGHVLTWNTSRSVMNPNSADVCIDLGVGTCCTAIAFHPQQPSLLAGATSTGAIYMYVLPLHSASAFL